MPGHYSPRNPQTWTPVGGTPASDPSKFTPSQVATLWKTNNPWSSRKLTILMVAIAGAESGYNPRADNGIAAGLWQVNYHAHPQWTAQELYDPNTNAKAAGEVYRSQGLGAWTTYTNGAYRNYLTAARTATTGTIPGWDPVTAAADGISSAWSAATAVPKFLGDLGSLLFTQKGWLRLLKLFAGVALAIIALHSLFKNTAAYQTAKKAAVATAA